MFNKKRVSICIALVMIMTALFSVSVFATDAPTAPTNLTATKIAATAIELSWTASTDDEGISYYVIWNRNTNDSYTTTSTKYAVVGLTPVTYYDFDVFAIDTELKSSPLAHLNNDVQTSTQANTTYQVYGNIEPDIIYFGGDDALKDFKVEIQSVNPSYYECTYTNLNGEYMFPMVPSDYVCTIIISKPGFLTRTLQLSAITGNITIDDQAKDSIILWPGELTSDGAINQADVMALSAHYNTERGESGYDVVCDFNRNGYINDADLDALNNHWGTISSNYPTNYVVSSAQIKPQY